MIRAQRQPKTTSASQLSMFEDCPRKWWFRYVAGRKPTKHESAQLGDNVHKALECWYSQPDPHAQLVLPPFTDEDLRMRALHALSAAVAARTLPMRSDVLACEKGISVQGFPLPVSGYIDVVARSQLFDYKTTASGRFAKTEETLFSSWQATFYGLYARHELGRAAPRFTHIYMTTREPYASWRVSVTLPDSYLRDRAAEGTATIQTMQEAARLPLATRVPAVRAACKKYGGCPYSFICTAENTLETNMDILEQLNKRRQAAGMGGSPPQQQPPQQQPPQQQPPQQQAMVYPPLSTPLQAPQSSPEQLTALPINAPDGVTKEEAVAAVPTTAPSDAPQHQTLYKRPLYIEEKALPAVEYAARGQILFNRCLPLGDQQVVYLHDLLAEICEEVAQENGVAHYSMLAYGKGKEQIAAKLKEQIDQVGVPPYLVVDERQPSQRACIEIVMPRYDTIVQAFG